MARDQEGEESKAVRTDIDLNYFKKRLEERLKAITEGQERHAAASHVQSHTARLTDLERQRIQSALTRMGAEEYGYCVICEEERDGRRRHPYWVHIYIGYTFQHQTNRQFS